MSYTITTSTTVANVETVGYASNNSQKVAQSFTTVGAGVVSAITVVLSKPTSPTDGIQIDVMGDNAGVPDGVSVGNGTIAASSLTGSAADYTITLGSPVSVASSTNYWVQITRTGSLSTVNYYSAGGENPALLNSTCPYKGLRWGDGSTNNWLNADNFTLRLSMTVAPAGTNWTQTLTDTNSYADTIVRSITRVMTETDSYVDSLVRSVTRVLTNTNTYTDTFLGAFVILRVFTETLTNTDIATKILNGSSTIWAKVSKSSAAAWTKINKAGQ